MISLKETIPICGMIPSNIIDKGVLSVLKVGIIGAGLMGAQYAKTLADIPDVQVTAVTNRSRDKAESLANLVGAKVYDDYRDLIDSDVDAVWVCTPDFLHREFSVAVLEANKHLFVEKVLATTLEDGRAILEAAEKAGPGIKSMVGYPMHFRPQFQFMKKVFKEQNEPALMAWSLRTHFLTEGQLVYDRSRDQYYHAPSWYFDRSTGKGPIFSHCSHDYNMLMRLCGPVKSVQAQGDTYLLKEGNVADAFVVTLRFESGGVATVSTPWVARVDYDMMGVATAGLTVMNNNGEIHLKRPDAPEERVKFDPAPAWPRIANHFISCIKDGGTPEVSIAEGFQTLLVAEAAFRSLYEKREVTIAELQKEIDHV